MKNQRYKKNKIAKYFRKQKLMGVLIILLGILTAVIAGGDITVALFVVPLGLFLCFTKEAVWMDDDYSDYLR